MNIGTSGVRPSIRAVPCWANGCQGGANKLAVQANTLIDRNWVHCGLT